MPPSPEHGQPPAVPGPAVPAPTGPDPAAAGSAGPATLAVAALAALPGADAAAAPRRRPRRRTPAALVRVLPWLVLALGLVATVAVEEVQRRHLVEEHLRREQALARDVARATESKLRDAEATLAAVAGLFRASDSVTAAEFAGFYRTLQLSPQTLQGIQGVGFIALAPDRQALAALAARQRAAGRPDFQIQPSGPSPLATAVLFLEPLDWRNQRALGINLYADPVRREAMRWAVATGQSSLSGPVRLAQEAGRHLQRGSLLFLPVYGPGATPTVPGSPDLADPAAAPPALAARWRQLRGWAYAPLRMGDLISVALAESGNSELRAAAVLVYDGTRPNRDALLFDSARIHGTPLASHVSYAVLPIANRNWLIGIQLDNASSDPLGLTPGLGLLVLLGLSLSGVAALSTRLLVNNHLAIRQALEEAQQASRERALAATVFETSPLGIIVTDAAGLVLSTNLAFTQISGYSRQEARGHRANLLKSGRHDETFYRRLWHELIQNGYWSGEIWNRHRNGQIRRHELVISAVVDASQAITNFVGMLRDVTDRYEEQEAIRHQAMHDYLTGLPNRALLMQQLAQALAMGRRHGSTVGLLFMDLDGFKPVNDAHGHGVGDQLLQLVARRLQQNVRETDTLCRQGGDEFVLLIPNAPDLEQLVALARKLQEAVARPYRELPGQVAVTVSIGIARWPDHGVDADQLLDAADAAMYLAKHGAPDHIAVATPSS